MILFISFLISLFWTGLILVLKARHAHLSNDHDVSGPQKFHGLAVPRVGGVGIFLGVLVATAIHARAYPEAGRLMLLLVASSAPVFLSGVVEDLTKRVSVAWRLLFTVVSPLAAMLILGTAIGRIDVDGLDGLVRVPLVSALLTVAVVAGVTQSYNLIDGFNGLASMCVMQALIAFAWAALQTGDDAIRGLSLVVVGATLGFFVLNYPRGGIFLGDGGAYFLGFVVAEIALLLIQRNPRISPMFPVTVCSYPIFETLFTIYRRRFVHRTPAGRPDALHLHHLVYKRLTRRDYDRRDVHAQRRRNSTTAPWLWGLSVLPAIAAVRFWNRTPALLLCMAGFMLLYVLVYRRIARFGVPRWVTRGWR